MSSELQNLKMNSVSDWLGVLANESKRFLHKLETS